ncbi:heat shock protein beta-11-like [Vidua macroura]|uniref:heat shock protein beta-11-like n=1 Tax=Vidua macroura TaxID=187451 RepID=UPI0023A827B2|nr:heat shock protein beta-11-like [Vidua macroura]
MRGTRPRLQGTAIKASDGSSGAERFQPTGKRTEAAAAIAAATAAAAMLCRMHLAPFASSSLASRLGTVRTLWPHAETIFTELQQEMEKAREFMSSFEQLLSNHGAIATEHTPSTSMTLTHSSGDGFSVCQDVKNFAPEELSVKVVGRKVVLVGQKETQNVDEKGSFSYKYEVLKREWDVPEEVDAEALTCSLSKDGQLRIEAPKLALPAAPERSVPIQVSPAAPQTGPASEEGATNKAQV